ncbi:MAG: PAS domain S-box protein [Bacteroidetes bacterium]|nr:PAS domain S-box protein [Bacteroidota bacterium]
MQRHHELILQSVGEGVYGLDCNGHTTFVNNAAANMLGWQLEDLIGKRQHDIIHHTKIDGSHYEVKDCPIYAAFKDGKIHRIDDEIFWRKNGSSFPVEYISTPIIDDKRLMSFTPFLSFQRLCFLIFHFLMCLFL